MQERATAGAAAQALLRVIRYPSTLGQKTVAHIDLARPRRGEWHETWAGLPGFRRVNGKYRHDCLPGWVYARHQIKTEMIPDLVALAERGVRPTEETST